MHVLRASPLSARTILEMEQIIRQFLWSSGIHRKQPLVAWHSICLPQSAFGLNVRRLPHVAFSFQTKQLNNLLQHLAAFWPLVMRAKYGPNPLAVPRTHCSPALHRLQLCALKTSHIRTRSVRGGVPQFAYGLMHHYSPRHLLFILLSYNSDPLSQVTIARLIDYTTATWNPIAFALGYCPH